MTQPCDYSPAAVAAAREAAIDVVIVNNALTRPGGYSPYCMRCDGLHRMRPVGLLRWRHDCGAEHDEAAARVAVVRHAGHEPEPRDVLVAHITDLRKSAAMLRREWPAMEKLAAEFDTAAAELEPLVPLLARSPRDDRMLWGVAANAGRGARTRRPRWAHVVEATGVGSTSAVELCRRFGFDPATMIGGDAKGEQE